MGGYHVASALALAISMMNVGIAKSREISTKLISTNWPTTPLSGICEAQAYWSFHGSTRQYEFLDMIISKQREKQIKMPETYAEGVNLALQISAEILTESSDGNISTNGNLKEALLSYSLAMREFAPLCELHRKLARENIQHASANAKLARQPMNTFAQLHSTCASAQLTNLSSLFELLMLTESSPCKAGDGVTLLGPEEVPMWIGGDEQSANAIVILYGHVTTDMFAEWYTAVKDYRGGSIGVVIRHRGATDYEETKTESNECIANYDEMITGGTTTCQSLAATETVLQGYGVRLDIRNVEYKAFEEKNDNAAEIHNIDSESVDQNVDLLNEFRAGVNMTAFAERLANEQQSSSSSSSDYLRTLQARLIKIDSQVLALVQQDLPAWKRKNLPLQAASIITSANDPLWKLQDISQNLPSRVPFLLGVDALSSLKTDADYIQRTLQLPAGSNDGATRIFVNGREINVSRTSLNVFELLRVLREENEKVVRIQNSMNVLSSVAAKKGVVALLEGGEESLEKLGKSWADDMREDSPDEMLDPIRIDVARGSKGAITYINNIEKDDDFAHWSPQLIAMIQAAQGGGPPTVRRNLFTVLVVMDPFDPNHYRPLLMMTQLIQSNFPIRLGILIANEGDIKACRKDPEHWKAEFDRSDVVTAADVLGVLKLASAHGWHIAVQFMVAWKNNLEAWQAQNSDPPERSLLLHTYAALLQNTVEQGKDSRFILQKVVAQLSEMDIIVSYSTGVRYAEKKGIFPGMGFLNGLPLPDPSSESFGNNVYEVLDDEKNRLFMKVMQYQITDTKPKSIYASVLKGDSLYTRYHPLLASSKSKKIYVELPPSEKSATFSVNAESSKIVMSIDAVVDDAYSSSGMNIIEFLKSVPSLPIDGDDVGFNIWVHSAKDMERYLPKDVDAQNYILMNGRFFEVENGQSLSQLDIEMLAKAEIARARSLTKLLTPYFSSGTREDLHIAVSQIARFVGGLFSAEKEAEIDRVDIQKQLSYLTLRDNDLHHVFNEESDSLLKVVAIVDPLSEATQRSSPLLLAIRDHLKLPLDVVFLPNMDAPENEIPTRTYYRFLADKHDPSLSPTATFTNLPTKHVLTMRMDVPEQWDVQQVLAEQDTDNLRCDASEGDCNEPIHLEYGLKGLLLFGQCLDISSGNPTQPNGLQLSLSKHGMEDIVSDTVVMKTMGYWQLEADVGLWDVKIAYISRGAKIFSMIGSTEGSVDMKMVESRKFVVKDFHSYYNMVPVGRKPGMQDVELLTDGTGDGDIGGLEESSKGASDDDDDVVHVFSLATGHTYERLLRIMMLSVTKRTSVKVKFWLFENFLSPSFKSSALTMASKIGCEIEFVTYKWPEWLRAQTEKQRIIWGYKILFLDVLFPLNLKRIIYVDADQVMRGDLKELWDLDLEGAPYGYTPFCDSKKETLGYQFWRQGFWKDHLQDKPYHISALYVVDLQRFRRQGIGDTLRSNYQYLTNDPTSLANLDQDLPNVLQTKVPIFSLPQDWLWCETWCSEETKATAKTIDLCNNPQHKEPKLSMAKRVISGDLFEESWEELDEEVRLLTLNA